MFRAFSTGEVPQDAETVDHLRCPRAGGTALPFGVLREEIANSVATTRVLVLDCCFSGRAIDAMTDDQGVIGGQLDVAGTYTLTSTSANAPSHAPAGDRFTAFTSALLRASVARGDANDNSDLDLLIDASAKTGLFDLAGFALGVEQLMAVFTQVVTVPGLKPRIRDRVVDSAVPL